MDENNSSGLGKHFMKGMNSNKSNIVAKNLRPIANYKLQIVKLRTNKKNFSFWNNKKKMEWCLTFGTGNGEELKRKKRSSFAERSSAQKQYRITLIEYL